MANVDLVQATWDNGPRIKLADGYITTSGNGTEYINTPGPLGAVVFGAALSSIKGAGASLTLQLQHRTGSGGEWANIGVPHVFTATGKKTVAVAGVLDRVRIVRTVAGSSPKFFLSQASLAPGVGVTPQELDSGAADAADIIAALVALGLVTDIAS